MSYIDNSESFCVKYFRKSFSNIMMILIAYLRTSCESCLDLKMLIYLTSVQDIVRNTTFLAVEEYIFSRKSKIPIFPTGKVFFVHNIKDHLSIKTRSGVIIYVTFEYEYCGKSGHMTMDIFRLLYSILIFKVVAQKYRSHESNP